ncbi:MAG: hypothetical protein JW936_09430 [Sedimentisphaerales bacterium]|nr:hypothetical protein [Sedimentisphaerales bacterium]
MIQCQDCEFFIQEPNGRITLKCNPFTTVKEPECLQKWQLLRLDALVQGYQATLNWYRKLAPMQEKMFKFMQHEMDDIDDADSWKYQNNDDDDIDENSDNPDDNLFR